MQLYSTTPHQLKIAHLKSQFVFSRKRKRMKILKKTNQKKMYVLQDKLKIYN